MDLARARYLTSAHGSSALAGLPNGLAELPVTQLSKELRKRYPADEAAALGEQVALRSKAEQRGVRSTGWLFSPTGLEMMTHPLVARRRAERLMQIGLRVADLTCGLGGDLSAATGAGIESVGSDNDVPTSLFAASNVPAAAVVVGDAQRSALRIEDAAVLIDPSRRAAGGRRFDPALFSPTWDACMELALGPAAAVVKGPPGIGDAHLPPEAEVEVVQLGRTLREATLWFGRGAVPGLRRAVRLPQNAEITSEHEAVAQSVVPIGAVIFDPAPCVTRAGLVRHVAATLDAGLVDPFLAYLTAPSARPSPFATAFEVLDVVRFSIARLRKTLRENHWKPDEIRRRAFPIEPDELRKLLKIRDGEAVTLLCMTLAGQKTVAVGRRVS